MRRKVVGKNGQQPFDDPDDEIAISTDSQVPNTPTKMIPRGRHPTATDRTTLRRSRLILTEQTFSGFLIGLQRQSDSERLAMENETLQAMTVRRMNFAFTPGMERVFVKDDPDTSYTFLGTWMMLPYLEPYLIRTMRQALPHIREPQLKEDLKRFCAQEGEHYKQHALANELIRDLVPGFAALKPIEMELDAEFKRFSKDKPLKFNLAYAEGFESMTSAMSRAQLETGMFDRTDSPLADLAKWHIMEEIEHRTVAFDIYEHVVGSYLYRLRIGSADFKHAATSPR